MIYSRQVLEASCSTTSGLGSGSTVSQGTGVSSEIGTVNVTVDDTSVWTLTADTYISSFSGSLDQIVTNGYTLYVGGEAVK